MDINNPVIVMALYDIGRENWNNFKMSYHTYGWWMRNTLSLDSNIVVYTESKFMEELVNYRKEFDPTLEKTIFIEQPLSELPMYKKYYDSLSELMSSESFKSKVGFPDVPEMCQPLYNVIMFNKVFFLKDTIEKKYFNNDIVVWADAGGLRNEVSLYQNKKWPSISKIKTLDPNKITFFSHNQDFNVYDREFHSLSQIRNIQGTSFLLPSHLIDPLLELVVDTVDECINSGYIGSDEKIFDICYTKQKDLFYLIKSNWREYFDIMLESDKLKVVVSRYNEDVEWAKGLKYEAIIFNKNESENHLFKNNLPNVGREGHTFFKYIVDNYYNLSDYTAFLQGNPYDHCSDVVSEINNFGLNTNFKPLGPLFEETTSIEHINQQILNYGNRIGFEITFPVYYVRGAQYIISRELIHTKPKSYYEKILDTLSHSVCPQEGYDVEKTLFQLYGIYKP
jgi:hypothetical protein